jgi:hypothetical protein
MKLEKEKHILKKKAKEKKTQMKANWIKLWSSTIKQLDVE